MFGNRLGWSISVAMVVMTVAALWALNAYIESVSARTAFSLDPTHGAKIELPVPPSAVWPTMNDPADAGELYRNCLRVVQDNEILYAAFLRRGTLDEIVSVPAINLLVQAKSHSHAAIFANHPEEVINYDGDQPAVTALLTAGQCARRAGQLLAASQPQRACDLFVAEFSLGAKLYEERLTYAELNAGLTLLAEGSGMLQTLPAELLPDGFVETARRFDTNRKTLFIEQLEAMHNVIGSVDQSIIESTAGDIFYFAQNAAERTWRVEAILKLGRYRFNAGRIGDQQSAARTLRKLREDYDPIIRAAADAGLGLTIEAYRMLK